MGLRITWGHWDKGHGLIKVDIEGASARNLITGTIWVPNLGPSFPRLTGRGCASCWSRSLRECRHSASTCCSWWLRGVRVSGFPGFKGWSWGWGWLMVKSWIIAKG